MAYGFTGKMRYTIYEIPVLLLTLVKGASAICCPGSLNVPLENVASLYKNATCSSSRDLETTIYRDYTGYFRCELAIDGSTSPGPGSEWVGQGYMGLWIEITFYKQYTVIGMNLLARCDPREQIRDVKLTYSTGDAVQVTLPFHDDHAHGTTCDGVGWDQIPLHAVMTSSVMFEVLSIYPESDHLANFGVRELQFYGLITNSIAACFVCYDGFAMYGDGEEQKINASAGVFVEYDPYYMYATKCNLGLLPIMMMDFESGLTTDSSWKCTMQQEDGWQMRDFNDSHWPQAVEVHQEIWLGEHNISDWCQYNMVGTTYSRFRDDDEIDQCLNENCNDAKWIRTADPIQENQTLYCRRPALAGIDHCQTDLCHNGTCWNVYVGYHCICNPGYTGKHCEHDLCYDSPCEHGGNCTVVYHDYNCVYDHHINTSVCTDVPASYHCQCTDGYNGADCHSQAEVRTLVVIITATSSAVVVMIVGLVGGLLCAKYKQKLKACVISRLRRILRGEADHIYEEIPEPEPIYQDIE